MPNIFQCMASQLTPSYNIPSNYKLFTPLVHSFHWILRNFNLSFFPAVSQAFTCFSVSDCRGDVVSGVGRPGDCCGWSGLSFLIPNEGCTNCFCESAPLVYVCTQGFWLLAFHLPLACLIPCWLRQDNIKQELRNNLTICTACQLHMH